MDIEWCKSCDKGLPAPDVIIYLDMPIETSSTRGKFGEERYENIDFQKMVRLKFMELKQADDDKDKKIWQMVDATRTVEEIQTEVRAIAEKTVEEVAGKEINMLWL